MHRQKIRLNRSLIGIQVRAKVRGQESPAVGPSDSDLQAAKDLHLQQQSQQIRGTLDAIGEALGEYEQRRQQSLNELQKIAIELAVMAASHVVHAELKQDNLGVEKLVSAAVSRLGLSGPAIIRLHPADLVLLQSQLGSQPVPWDQNRLTLVADVSVSRGGVRLETNSGRVVFSDVVSRLADIRHEWMENLDDTQAECRRVPNDSQSLRRFPDRRETA